MFLHCLKSRIHIKFIRPLIWIVKNDFIKTLLNWRLQFWEIKTLPNLAMSLEDRLLFQLGYIFNVSVLLCHCLCDTLMASPPSSLLVSLAASRLNSQAYALRNYRQADPIRIFLCRALCVLADKGGTLKILVVGDNHESSPVWPFRCIVYVFTPANYRLVTLGKLLIKVSSASFWEVSNFLASQLFRHTFQIINIYWVDRTISGKLYFIVLNIYKRYEVLFQVL